MSKVEEAVSRFRNGINCAQAILSTYGPEYGLEQPLALKVALGLGGGLGRGGEVCGAVSGAVLAIGLKMGSEDDPCSKEAREKTYSKVREFSEKFKVLHGSLVCKVLLGCDISTKEGMREARGKELFSTVCPDFVADAARILEEVLSG